MDRRLALCAKIRSDGAFRRNLDPKKAALAGCCNFYFITRPVAKRFSMQDDAVAGKYLEQALENFLSGVERRA